MSPSLRDISLLFFFRILEHRVERGRLDLVARRPAGEEQRAVDDDRTSTRARRHPDHRPILVARFQVIGDHLSPSRRHDLLAMRRVANDRGAERRSRLSLFLPLELAG